jgi:hypothetical protein
MKGKVAAGAGAANGTAKAPKGGKARKPAGKAAPDAGE